MIVLLSRCSPWVDKEPGMIRWVVLHHMCSSEKLACCLVGNGGCWSITIKNHPSNPQQPYSNPTAVLLWENMGHIKYYLWFDGSPTWFDMIWLGCFVYTAFRPDLWRLVTHPMRISADAGFRTRATKMLELSAPWYPDWPEEFGHHQRWWLWLSLGK